MQCSVQCGVEYARAIAQALKFEEKSTEQVLNFMRYLFRLFLRFIFAAARVALLCCGGTWHHKVATCSAMKAAKAIELSRKLSWRSKT
jgi:hypothetical protein